MSIDLKVKFMQVCTFPKDSEEIFSYIINKKKQTTTKMIYAKKTCNDCQTIKRDLKILLNHSDGDVNSDFYLWKMQFPVNRVALYDQYYPY